MFTYGYELPFGRGRKFWNTASGPVEHAIGGWQLQGITNYRTGLPFTVSAAGNVSNTQSGDRPDAIAPADLPGGERLIDRWFNTAAFRAQAPFTFGNSGRDTVSAPAQFGMDFSLFKNFLVRERVTLQFRAEVFNLPNHANFAAPNPVLGTAAFGRITATTTAPRQYQFALKCSR